MDYQVGRNLRQLNVLQFKIHRLSRYLQHYYTVTVPDEIYSVDDSSEWIDEWWKHIGSGPAYAGETEDKLYNMCRQKRK